MTVGDSTRERIEPSNAGAQVGMVHGGSSKKPCDRLGAFAGVLGFGALAVIIALWTAFRSAKEIHDTVLAYFQQYAAASADPRTQQILELLKTPDGFRFFMIFTLIITLIGFLIFSTVGGTLGTMLPHRKLRL